MDEVEDAGLLVAGPTPSSDARMSREHPHDVADQKANIASILDM